MITTKYYAPSNTYESYDTETDTFFNGYGQELRAPKEYNIDNEGYTPFGDE